MTPSWYLECPDRWSWCFCSADQRQQPGCRRKVFLRQSKSDLDRNTERVITGFLRWKAKFIKSSRIITVELIHFNVCAEITNTALETAAVSDRGESSSKAGPGSGRGRLLILLWSDVPPSPLRCSCWWWRQPGLQPAHVNRNSCQESNLDIIADIKEVGSSLTCQSTDCARVRVLDPADAVAASLVK